MKAKRISGRSQKAPKWEPFSIKLPCILYKTDILNPSTVELFLCCNCIIRLVLFRDTKSALTFWRLSWIHQFSISFFLAL